ncbi:MAG: BatA domain-containing protein [Acidobacteriota bacterium]
MSLLAPAFLVGLVVLAVPILVHLTHRPKATIVPFPSLMFLDKVPFRSMRRQRIRHWLLLLLRCTAVALLVLAFARPFIDRAGIAATLSPGAREVVILLDRSYSMGYANRWQRARKAASDAVSELAAADRASLVLFSNTAQTAVRSTSETMVLRNAVEATQLSQGATHYAPALKLARQLLEESDLPRREVILITDFQKTGWDEEDEVKLPEGTVFRAVDLSQSETSNVAVSDLIFQRTHSGGRQSLTVAARLTNQGNDPYEDLAVALDVDGKRVQTRTVALEPNSSTTVAFAALPVGDEILRATVRARSDALPQDNAFYFLATPGQAVGVLILEPNGAGASDSFYLQRALEIGNLPAFHVAVKRVGQFQPSDLEGAALVFLNDTPYPPGARGQRLRRFVKDGGGLVVALGELSTARDWLGADATALVPGFGEPIDRGAELGGTMATFDSAHPVFELFKMPRSGDFTSGSFYRYRPVQTLPTDRVLASFDDGSAALVERQVGSGRVLTWTSTLDTYWNNFPQQAVFLPFVHQLAKYATGYVEDSPFYVVGEAINLTDLDGATLPPGTEISVTSPAGEQSSYRVGQMPGGLQLVEPGFFDLSWSGGNGDRKALIAVNLDRSESDLSTMDAEEMAASVSQREGRREIIEASAEVTAEGRESRQALWWYLLVAAFSLLAVDTALSNSVSPTLSEQRTS